MKRLKDVVIRLECCIQQLTNPLIEEEARLQAEMNALKYGSEEYKVLDVESDRTRKKKWALDDISRPSTELLQVVYRILEFDRQFPRGSRMSPGDFDQLLRFRKYDHEKTVQSLTELLSEMRSVMDRYEYTIP